jgi:LuxR family maltose regulon positive regulatory protein
MVRPLLKTKLDPPPARSKLLPRPRLIEGLDGTLRHRLTLVCAPAGYGKTTALRQWAEHSDYRIAWFSLDPSDNDPTLFWTYFVSALRNLDKAVGQASLRMLRSSLQPSVETFLTVLINDLSSLKKQCILVVDDYHFIKNEAIHRGVTFLLEHLPEGIHLILLSRVQPCIFLSRLRLQGQLHELTASDLRFSRSEAEDFLNMQMGLTLSREQVATLDERTEGWIAGLKLAAISLKDREDTSAFIESFDGSQEYILRYLVEEVLNRHPPDLQAFLLKTSVLDRMSGPLCECVTGMEESPALLETLDEANLFVFPLDADHEWYRYHRLFQEALQNRLRRTCAQGIPVLHGRASRWYEEHRYPSDAIHHAFLQEDFERAALLIEQHCLPTFYRGETTTILNWLERLPEEMIRTRPLISVVQVYATFFDQPAGAHQILEQRLGDAERVILTGMKRGGEEGESNRGNHNELLGYLTAMRAHLARDRGEPPTNIVALSQRALDNVREDDDISRSLLLMNLAMAHRALGEVKEASSALEEARRLGDRSDLPLSTVYSAYLLAQIARLEGRLTDAVEICREGLRPYHSQRPFSGQPLPVVGALYVCLGAVQVERDERVEAERNLTRGIKLLRIMKDLDALLNGYATQVRLEMAEGKEFAEVTARIEEMERLGPEAHSLGTALRIRLLVDQAESNENCLSAAALLAQKQGLVLRPEESLPGIDHICQRRDALDFALVRLFIAQRRIYPCAPGQIDLDPVLSFLDRKLKEAEERNLITRMVEVRILKALTRQVRGDQDQALRDLGHALSLARAEGFVRLFLDEGETMGSLLRTAIARGIEQTYASDLWRSLQQNRGKRLSGPCGAAKGVPPVEPMSSRELQVLRLLAAGLSNREIAGELSLALGTVKKHVYNIYGKLSVTKRTQAAARARELSLL